MPRIAKFAALAAAAAVVAAAMAAGAAPQVVSTPSNGLATGPATGLAAGKPEATPEGFKDMMEALNRARARAGQKPLAWSARLAGEALAAAEGVEADECSNTATLKTARATGMAVYWSAPIRSFDGNGRAQTLRPSFIVSEWRDWGDGFKPGGSCTKAGDCASWGHVTRPAAKLAGCARVICANSAQVWICRAGE